MEYVTVHTHDGIAGRIVFDGGRLVADPPLLNNMIKPLKLKGLVIDPARQPVEWLRALHVKYLRSGYVEVSPARAG